MAESVYTVPINSHQFPRLTRWFLTEAVKVTGSDGLARNLFRIHQLAHRYSVEYLQHQEDLLASSGHLETDSVIVSIQQWLYQADLYPDGDSYVGD